MNPLALRELVDQVKDRTDIVDLISRDVQLVECGSTFKGRSPWNEDKTPSFVVWPQTQTWRDFSGGRQVGGDCIAYIMQRDHVGFIEGLRDLAVRTGVDIGALDGQSAPEEFAKHVERRRVEELLTAAAAYYHTALPDEIRKKWYRSRYGFTDETINKLQLGWADGKLLQHLLHVWKASAEEALSTGLFVRLGGGEGRIVDFFNHRLVFPYWVRSAVVYMIGRKTDLTPTEPWEEGKYKKLQTRAEKRPYISSTVSNEYFYNEDAARGTKQLLVTEGVTDCISAMQAGVPCISPVTVQFRKQDLPKLAALTERVDRVVICNDSEVNRAGEEGAMGTARALYAIGRDVRIATIPRPNGTDKIDVNELIVAEGPEALNRVLASAARFPEFLLGKIPADTRKCDLDGLLRPILALLANVGPVEREWYADLVVARFKLKSVTVQALLRAAAEGAADQDADEADLDPHGESSDDFLTEHRKGVVFEDKEKGHYTALRLGAREVISSFVLRPRRRIVMEEGELIDADAITEAGVVYQRLRFPRDSWHSANSLKKHLGPVDLQWTGTDDNVQMLLRLVAGCTVPTVRGTRNLGYYESPAGARWVSPDGVLGPEGTDTSAEELVYVDSGATLSSRVSYGQACDSTDDAAVARVVLPNLLRLNLPAVVLPIIGWFFAAPLKPRIQARLGHFPILFVWGTQGSGKSSLIMEIFWPLVGVVSTEPYSCTETEFAMLKLLSATNSVPVFMDEYKPFDMTRLRLNSLHRFMRRLYAGEVEERGRADLTIGTFRLAAPLCVAGETRPVEPALVERFLSVNPDKNQLSRNAEHSRAFSAIRTVAPSQIAPGLIRFLLARDTEADLATAQQLTARTLEGREVPYRVRDNIVVMVLGLLHFQGFAESRGILLPDLDLDGTVGVMLDELLEGGSAVKSGLDYFLEELSAMAVSREILHGRHYVYKDRHLALHFPSCHPAYCEHMRRTGAEGEVQDRKALHRQLQEERKRGGYILELAELVCFGGRNDRRRAVIVDVERAMTTLVIDGFTGDERE